MDVTTLETLKNQYPTSSWALWSPDYPEEGCAENNPSEFFDLIKRNRDELRPSVVLLSLNPSTKLPSNYLNFHSTKPKHRNDQFRDLIEEAGLEGAYMTDLVERTVDPDSGNVSPTDGDVNNLISQLEHLDEDSYQILCFHEKVFKTLLEFSDSVTRELPHDIRGFRSEINGFQIECYRVWFHANWGANRDKIPALQNQLSYLNAEVIGTGLAELSDWTE